MAERIGVIDIGSNTVRFVVFDGNSRSPLTFYNEKVTCRLGEGVKDTGRLSPKGVERALRALRRFKALGETMAVTKIITIATAAVRVAVDGPDFCAKALEHSGIEIKVISGEEEARLSALGVISGSPSARGLICDMGGSSLELAWVENGVASKFITTNFAPLSVELGQGERVAAELRKLRDRFPETLDQSLMSVIKDLLDLLFYEEIICDRTKKTHRRNIGDKILHKGTTFNGLYPMLVMPHFIRTLTLLVNEKGKIFDFGDLRYP